MKKNNWRFEALARAKIVRQNSCQLRECAYFYNKGFKNCSVPAELVNIEDCPYCTIDKKANPTSALVVCL